MRYVQTETATPVGTLRLLASEHWLAAILWENDRRRFSYLEGAAEEGGHPILAETIRQLDAYFAGRLEDFSLPLDVEGTPFQRDVWNALRSIPRGETRSYAEMARQIGRPAAVRAVGAANGRNPISIVVPCHRVIGAAGALTGFAGGLEAKAYLLALEGARRAA